MKTKKVKRFLLMLLAALLVFNASAIDTQAAAPEDISVPVEVVLTGKLPEVEEDYVIKMEGENADTPMPEGTVDGVYTMTVTGSFEGTLPKIEYNKLGVYNYTIWQEPGTNENCIYDDSVYHLKVTITNNADFTGYEAAVALRKEGSDEKIAGIIFKNHYRFSAEVNLEADKVLTGAELEAGAFEFDLLDENGNIIQTVTNDAEGNIVFDTLTFDKAGEYHYKMVEKAGSDATIIYDTTVYDVTITVTPTEDGYAAETVITVNGEVYEGIPVFSNEAVREVDFTIKAVKYFNGVPALPGTFGFVLIDDSGKIVDTTVNGLYGEIHFDEITYDKEGVYHYQIREIIGVNPVVVYDDTVYDVYVVVTMGEDGYETDVIIKRNGLPYKGIPVFYNKTRKPVDVDLDVDKLLDGLFPTEGQFEFALMDEAGNVVQTATNGLYGQVEFEELTFYAPGVYKYKVVEVIGTDEGIVYDDTEYEVTYIVTPNIPTIDGYNVKTVITVNGVEHTGKMLFNNTTRTPEDVILEGDKLLDDKAPEAGAFEFVLLDEAGNVVGTATNDAEGNIVFDALTFDKAGTYYYTMKEVIGNDEQIIYDETEYLVQIDVTANEATVDGYTVVVTITVDGEVYEGTPVFKNTSVPEEHPIPEEPEEPEDPEEPKDPVIEPGEEPEEPVKTGDLAKPIVWIVIAVAALVVIVNIIRRRAR